MRINTKSIICLLIFQLLHNVPFAQNGKHGHKYGKTPCMDVIGLFTRPGVPSMAQEEEFAPLIRSAENPPANLPGMGLRQHAMLYIGENCNRMSLVRNGQVTWTYSTGTGP